MRDLTAPISSAARFVWRERAVGLVLPPHLAQGGTREGSTARRRVVNPSANSRRPAAAVVLRETITNFERSGREFRATYPTLAWNVFQCVPPSTVSTIRLDEEAIPTPCQELKNWRLVTPSPLFHVMP